MPSPEPSEEDIRAIGARLAGRPIHAARPARAGGNNRIHRLEADGAAFALKFYPPQAADPRDRLGAEFAALAFLTRHGRADVPRPLAVDRARHCALYEWIEGRPVTAPGPADVEALARFLVAIQDLAGAADAGDLKPASASCLAPAAAVAQFEERLARLGEVAADFPDLAAFVGGRLAPASDGIIKRAAARLAAAGVDIGAEVAPELRALSPSDFGFHNALRRPDGRLAFLDFEYFGWDDPAKMLADAVLHPGMALDAAGRRRFLAIAGPHFAGRDAAFNQRFRFLSALCGLLWCLILLNEFLPERWWRRSLGGRRADPEAARARQLGKARRMLERVEREEASETA